MKAMNNVYYNKKIKRYLVHKDIDGKSHHFGSFESYGDAVDHRNYCESHNWDLKCKLNCVRGDGSPRRKVAHMFGVPVREIPR